MFQNLKNELEEDDFKKLVLQTDSDGYTGLGNIPLHNTSCAFEQWLKVFQHCIVHQTVGAMIWPLD